MTDSAAPTPAPGPALTVRPAAPGDAETLAHLIRELARFERLESQVTMTAELLDLQLRSPRPAFDALLAFEGHRPVGLALHYQTFSTFLGRPGIHLEDLYVLPEARGRGVGRLLLAAVARTAVERGCGRLEWDVLDWNAPAIAFYRSLGARPVEGWTCYRITGDRLQALAAGPAAAPGPPAQRGRG